MKIVVIGVELQQLLQLIVMSKAHEHSAAPSVQVFASSPICCASRILAV